MFRPGGIARLPAPEQSQQPRPPIAGSPSITSPTRMRSLRHPKEPPVPSACGSRAPASPTSTSTPLAPRTSQVCTIPVAGACEGPCRTRVELGCQEAPSVGSAGSAARSLNDEPSPAARSRVMLRRLHSRYPAAHTPKCWRAPLGGRGGLLRLYPRDHGGRTHRADGRCLFIQVKLFVTARANGCSQPTTPTGDAD